MTMNLAFASVAPTSPARACRRGTAAVSPDEATADPHVDEARGPSVTRLDDLLFGLAVTVLLVAVAVPWSSLSWTA